MAIYITAAEANQVLDTIVQAQVAAFGAQQIAMEVLNAETVAYVNKTRDDGDKSLCESKTSSEAYVLQEVGALKEKTQTHVGHVESKVEEMRSLVLQHDSAQVEALRRTRNLSTSLRSSQRRSTAPVSRLRQKCSGRRQRSPH